MNWVFWPFWIAVVKHAPSSRPCVFCDNHWVDFLTRVPLPHSCSSSWKDPVATFDGISTPP